MVPMRFRPLALLMSAAGTLSSYLTGGFANTIEDTDPENFSPQELLAWSSVHGLANLLVDGPVGNENSKEQKLSKAKLMIESLAPALKS